MKRCVDRSDQLVTAHKSMRKFAKWYENISIVGMCVVNSHLLWQIFGGVRDELTFKKLLFRELIEALDLPKYRSHGRLHAGLSSHCMLKGGGNFPRLFSPTAKKTNASK